MWFSSIGLHRASTSWSEWEEEITVEINDSTQLSDVSYWPIRKALDSRHTARVVLHLQRHDDDQLLGRRWSRKRLEKVDPEILADDHICLNGEAARKN